MKKINLYIILMMMLFIAGNQFISAQSSVQFKASITLTSGSESKTLKLGVSGDGTGGSITDNTIGVDEGSGFGLYAETLAPPTPPPPFAFEARFVTIPGRVSTYPTGLGGGVYEDYRGFESNSQVDTFKIVISGDNPDGGTTVVSWPSDLNLYGSSWTIKPQSGADWATTNMLTSTSVTIPAGGQKNILIIKTGATQPVPGPTFVLSTSSLDFGSVAVNTTSNLQVTVTNTGITNTLSITGVTLPSGYTVSPSAFPISLVAGASQIFTVTFSPLLGQTYSGNLVFAHNATGAPTNLAVTGVGQSQGGVLNFSSATKTTFDNSKDNSDSLKLNYVGQPLKALQFNLVSDSAVILKEIKLGSDLPADKWSLSYVFVRGTRLGNNTGKDTVKVVLLGLDTNKLYEGNYTNLFTFKYDVANISWNNSTTPLKLTSVMSSLVNGTNAQITAGVNQIITINNRTQKADVNFDDRIDVIDLIMIVDNILGKLAFTTEAKSRADVSPWPAGDGIIDVRDLALAQKMILDGTYPDGTPIAKPVNSTLYVKNSGSNKTSSFGLDAKIIFSVSSKGIDVILENEVPVRGIQIELDNLSNVPENFLATSTFGRISYKSFGNSLRAIIYDDANGSVIEPGNHIIAKLPFVINDLASVKINDVTISGIEYNRITKSSSEIVFASETVLPTEFSLEQNFPNPFNPSTIVRFSVPKTSDVSVVIYDFTGSEVKTLFSGTVEAGTKTASWDGTNNSGNILSSGTYFVRMISGDFVQTRKMIFLK
jgi:hypothetical protein